MAIVTATNSSSPNTVKWAGTDADIYDRASQLAGLAENFDLHDHDANKNLGVKRLQTTVAPTASGHVRVNADTFQWWAVGAAAVRTAIDLEGAQTIAGLKTFTPGAVFNASVYLNATGNASSTLGLTVNQGAADDAIVSLKSSDVAHGMTNYAESDTFGYCTKVQANDGGLLLNGLTEVTTGLTLWGFGTTENATKSNAGLGAIRLEGYTKSGTGVVAMGATANICTIGTNGTARFIFQADGSAYEDVGTSWTNFDSYDDVALLTDISRAASRPDDPIHSAFRDWADVNRERLQAMDLIHFNEDEHHFVNRSKMQMLLIGAVRQQAASIRALADELTQVRALLPAGGS